MYESGDWISPRRNGVIWVDYPPFLYWAGCASAWVLGEVSEFTLRLPSALGAILMQRGQIADKGVLPPEACVSPTDFLELAQRYMGLGAGDTDSESGGLTLETIDAAGNSTVVKL